MTTLIQLLINQSPTLLALIAVCYVLYQKIQHEATLTKERFDNVNTRIDDLRKNTNARLERIEDDYRTLNTKMDTMSAQINRIEGALSLPRTGTED